MLKRLIFSIGILLLSNRLSNAQIVVTPPSGSTSGTSVVTACGSSDTQVLFTDGTVCAGDSGLTFNKTTNVLTNTGGLGLSGVNSFTGTSFGTLYGTYFNDHTITADLSSVGTYGAINTATIINPQNDLDLNTGYYGLNLDIITEGTKKVGNLFGIYAIVNHGSSGDGGSIFGASITARSIAGDAPSAIGLQSTAGAEGGSVVPIVTSVEANAYAFNATVTTSKGISIPTATFTGGSTVTNVYGLFIENQTVGGTTLNYAIDVNAAFRVAPDGSAVTVANINSGADGVKMTGADGVLTFLGMGNGNDENLLWDFDNAASNVIGVSSGTSAAKIDFGTITLEADYNSSDGTAGLTQTCAAAVVAVTVKDGLITSITCP